MTEGKPAEVVLRPIKYEAIQYRPDIPNCTEVAMWLGVDIGECDIYDAWHKKEGLCVYSSDETYQFAQPGDWIVALVPGEKYQVVSDSTFTCMYKEINSEAN